MSDLDLEQIKSDMENSPSNWRYIESVSPNGEEWFGCGVEIDGAEDVWLEGDPERDIPIACRIARVPDFERAVINQAARIEALEAERDEAVTALMSLERRATRVSDRGATTGPQWTQLTIGILAARSVLSRMPAPIEHARAALDGKTDG